MNDVIKNSLASFLTRLTSAPGVYRMKDAEGHVLYVGKASNLKKRVTSYFSKQAGPKTRALVEQIHSIDVTVTRSETEALLLESNLIKALRPKYNVLLRDDKSYPYLLISKHLFPRMDIVRLKKKPKEGLFFGPYPSVTAVRETLGIIQKVFKIRHCTDTFFSARSRPCLQYQIKRCTAPCTKYISAEVYEQSVKDAIHFLQGKNQLILDELGLRMEQAVQQLAFEEAAQLRDQIKSLRLIQEQQGVAQWRGEADIIAIDAYPGFAAIQCVTIREGQVISSQSFFPDVPKEHLIESDAPLATLWQDVFSAFIAHHYFDYPERIPPLIVTHQPIDNLDALQSALSNIRGKKCRMLTHPRGTNARWLDFAKNNLQMAIEDRNMSSTLIQTRYEALQVLLNWTHQPIGRMECFDISHTQGESTVASCVVFDRSGPNKRDYRRFNITGITPGDDYAAMEQAIMRRFKRIQFEKKPLPDLLIIDGGKGQLAMARQVLQTLGIEGVYLLGIAKGPERKPGLERLILSDECQEITLPSDSPALHLLQHIRDEAHRFAITAHRKKRQKSVFDSSLETIEGIGPKRRQALLRRFGGIRELAKAPIEEIAKVKGISADVAHRIYDLFH